METLKLATRPVALILVWMAVSAYTISELSTVDRALTAPQASAIATAAPRQNPPAGAAFARRPASAR
jgi:hypothetical protein